MKRYKGNVGLPTISLCFLIARPLCHWSLVACFRLDHCEYLLISSYLKRASSVTIPFTKLELWNY